ncbi:hypothetical protein D777_02153 [Marinobacter nitratireducens]|uniref:Uncharacterized protein n=1 Tax=Marinobacter nitratireducens TaxID=1137280 RepID=A0A072ND20_9GAMM|nr:hypothetical protein [Marinobacter nitratireducens]KEF31000.1 hypothetical protein D777_02153 [Marinobacter nitratireducens]TNE99908.1 MAG: hypothetical protein EP328_02385 [Gammaproteobacteria bacterium]
MAFHNPDPKLREIELENARLRSAMFSRVYRRIGRFLMRLMGKREGEFQKNSDASGTPASDSGGCRARVDD